eukprot:CAMPEP_0171192640 /NCGR_PEP_ID=MMETSP0790-20130122/19973_1 /TAXON_ID=2925 /ORGANISM="Alexandrium catenella, Strain OF101" /LENGTH=228 /DNA_ID=CAMNT_0011657803 /DNA_START=92 /DNA_END=774 /DNA_ORIENTATION=+
MESVSPKKVAGWVGNDDRVEEGVLPRWDRPGAVGMVVDTCSRRLGFCQDGRVLPFELPLPATGTLHFAVGWSGDTGGTVRIERLQRLTQETHGPLARLLASLRAQPDAAAAVVREYVRANAGRISAEVLAEIADALPEDSRCRAAAVATLARALCCGGACGSLSSLFASAAVQSLRLRSARERLAMDLAGHVLDPWNYDAIVVSSALPGLSGAKRARLASRLWQPRLG